MISQELIDKLSDMKVGNATTINQKMLLLMFSYELIIEGMKERKPKKSKMKETIRKICN